MAKRKCYMIGSLIIVLLVCFLNQDSKNVHALQKGISSQVIRFHVLANSDSEEDQEMKLKVRDGVVAFVQKKLKKAESKDEAEKIIQKNLSKIKREANKILKEENYESQAVAKLTREEFPVKCMEIRYFLRENTKHCKWRLEKQKVITGGVSCIQAFVW